MPASTVRDRVLKAVGDLPPSATYEDVMERVYVLHKIEQGLREVDAGRGVPHEQAREQARRWHG